MKSKSKRSNFSDSIEPVTSATVEGRRHQVPVLIADSDSVFRRFLRHVLNNGSELVSRYEVVAEVVELNELLSAISRTSPAVILLDLSLPMTGGLEVTRLIKLQWPGIRIVMFCEIPGDVYRIAAERAGADVCVAKSDEISAIRRAIDHVSNPTRERRTA